MKKKIDINVDDETLQENNRRNFVQVPAMTKPIPLPKERIVEKVDNENGRLEK